MAKEKPKYYYTFPTDEKTGRRYTTKEFKEFIPPELKNEILIIDEGKKEESKVEEKKQEETKVKPKKK